MPEDGPIYNKDRCSDPEHISFLRIFFFVSVCQAYLYISHKVKKKFKIWHCISFIVHETEGDSKELNRFWLKLHVSKLFWM